MSHLIVVFNQDGVKELTVEKMGLATLKKYATQGVGRLVECAGCRFSDQTIDIWCDEEGRINELPVWAQIKETEEHFCGPVMVCSSDDNGNSLGLTPEQADIVRKELTWVPGFRGAEPRMEFMPWPENYP